MANKYDDLDVGFTGYPERLTRDTRRRVPAYINDVAHRLQTQADRTRAQADRLEQQAIMLRSLQEPDDPNEPPVIRFDRTFSSGKTYAYAAIKCNGLWYTTGPQSPKAYSWIELITWLIEGTDNGVPVVWVVTDYVQVGS